MRIVVAPAGQNAGTTQRLDDSDQPLGPPENTADLAATIAADEAAHRPRWIWPDTSRIYPALQRKRIRVERAHDIALAESALLGYAGRWGEPTSLPAIVARSRGEEPPTEPAVTADNPDQPRLFEDTDDGLPEDLTAFDATLAAYRRQKGPADQKAAYEPTPVTRRHLDLMIAADSAGALAAAEMSRIGLPWRADVHDQILTEALGPRPPQHTRPAKLQALADEIAARLHTTKLNPDSAAELIRAFQREGLTLESTRAWELKRLEHPAVEPLLTYKSLARLHTANGWAWRDSWVQNGRFRPEYVAAAVVSGRWATRGGGALQIPKAVRAAVVAEPGFRLVVADAQQLEPRVLAAMSADRGMTEAAAHGDLYAALAEQSFKGDRAQAKVGLLSAMYGGSTPAMSTLRRRYPDALALLEKAATTGESGGIVRSVLGRTCPAPRSGWDGGPERQAMQKARDRGRFTRNFVIQASAADWAAVLLALLRTSLPDGAELVFFQHDEVVVHCPAEQAEAAAESIRQAAERATALVLGNTPVRLLLSTAVVTNYAEAK
jgi:DNA polymerase-1